MSAFHEDTKRNGIASIFNLCAVRLDHTNIEFEELEHPSTQMEILTNVQ